jgi:spermidine/putrescine ABC transporter ATP-binding subunit
LQRIEFNNVGVRYQETVALRSVSLAVEPGEFLALLGPSGCGKTTLLRVIGGFTPYEGSVLFDGQPVDGVPAHRREIGIVFQDYALFPHKTVRENIAFGLRMRRMSAAGIQTRAAEMLSLLRLDGLGERYPAQLSGGQQQRVALARAIAIGPKLLLLDEPLGALDKKLREEMQVELRQLQKRLGITTIFVTHDQEEALSLADRIAVMRSGQIQQIGPVADVYERPATRFVAEFMGQSNIFEAKVADRVGQRWGCHLQNGTLVMMNGIEAREAGQRVWLSIRPEKLRIAGEADGDGAAPHQFAGVVDHATYLGGFFQVRVRLPTGEILKMTAQNDGAAAGSYAVGSPLRLAFDPADAVVLAE